MKRQTDGWTNGQTDQIFGKIAHLRIFTHLKICFLQCRQQFLLNLVQKDKAIRPFVIKRHECNITKAGLTVLGGLLCSKCVHQSFLCIGAWRGTLEASVYVLVTDGTIITILKKENKGKKTGQSSFLILVFLKYTKSSKL